MGIMLYLWRRRRDDNQAPCHAVQRGGDYYGEGEGNKKEPGGDEYVQE
jgi:hypothetical protein